MSPLASERCQDRLPTRVMALRKSRGSVLHLVFLSCRPVLKSHFTNSVFRVWSVWGAVVTQSRLSAHYLCRLVEGDPSCMACSTQPGPGRGLVYPPVSLGGARDTPVVGSGQRTLHCGSETASLRGSLSAQEV